MHSHIQHSHSLSRARTRSYTDPPRPMNLDPELSSLPLLACCYCCLLLPCRFCSDTLLTPPAPQTTTRMGAGGQGAGPLHGPLGLGLGWSPSWAWALALAPSS